MPNATHPFALLSQDTVLDAVEALGFYGDGRVFPLNSYENRVYQVGIEDGTPIVAKFYRPGRWIQACIQEELDFLQELSADDLPVVAPIELEGKTLFEHQGFYFALFPRRGGQAPELSSEHDLALLGRHLARLHQAGARKKFRHRPSLKGAPDLRLASEQVLASGFLPKEYAASYQELSKALMASLTQRFQVESSLRLHGDMHLGNLLLRDDTLYLVDFDDCLQGPAMQDIWLLLSGDASERQRELGIIAQGYELFRSFPWHEVAHIEMLRTIRIMKYAAWLAQRWQDPAFPQAFPWFASPRFWGEHIDALREQLRLLEGDY